MGGAPGRKSARAKAMGRKVPTVSEGQRGGQCDWSRGRVRGR